MKITKAHADYWMFKNAPKFVTKSLKDFLRPKIDHLINSQVSIPHKQKMWENQASNAVSLAKGFRERGALIAEITRISNGFCQMGRHKIYARWLRRLDKVK